MNRVTQTASSREKESKDILHRVDGVNSRVHKVKSTSKPKFTPKRTASVEQVEDGVAEEVIPSIETRGVITPASTPLASNRGKSATPKTPKTPTAPRTKGHFKLLLRTSPVPYLASPLTHVRLRSEQHPLNIIDIFRLNDKISIDGVGYPAQPETIYNRPDKIVPRRHLYKLRAPTTISDDPHIWQTFWYPPGLIRWAIEGHFGFSTREAREYAWILLEDFCREYNIEPWNVAAVKQKKKTWWQCIYTLKSPAWQSAAWKYMAEASGYMNSREYLLPSVADAEKEWAGYLERDCAENEVEYYQEPCEKQDVKKPQKSDIRLRIKIRDESKEKSKKFNMKDFQKQVTQTNETIASLIAAHEDRMGLNNKRKREASVSDTEELIAERIEIKGVKEIQAGKVESKESDDSPSRAPKRNKLIDSRSSPSPERTSSSSSSSISEEDFNLLAAEMSKPKHLRRKVSEMDIDVQGKWKT